LRLAIQGSLPDSQLLDFLRELDPADQGAVSAYFRSSTTVRSVLTKFPVGFSDSDFKGIQRVVDRSETGALVLFGQSSGYVIVPPFAIMTDEVFLGWNFDPLLGILKRQPIIGVLLLRLGRYAIGVFHGKQLIESKVGKRYVKGRHKAGGSSQGRFSRIREDQSLHLFDRACRVFWERVAPHSGELDCVFFGGEQLTLAGFKKRCHHLSSFSHLISRRILNSGEPSQKELVRAPYEIWKSQVSLLEMDNAI